MALSSPAKGLASPPFKLAKAVVTSFGDQAEGSLLAMKDEDDNSQEYVFQCIRNQEASLLAVSLSSHAVQLRDPESLQTIAKNQTHEATISEIHFIEDLPNTILSCSKDGTAKLWDYRQNKSTQLCKTGSEIWSGHIGCGGNLLGVTKEETALFYDIRTGKKLGEYVESHPEAITQLRFHPIMKTNVITASEDGIVCMYDCRISNEEDATLTTLFAESSISKIGFVGPKREGIYILTGTETMSLWNLDTAERMIDLPNIRTDLERLQAPADYLVDCCYEDSTGDLFLLSGSHAGDVALMHIIQEQKAGGTGGAMPASRVQVLGMLSGGHTECVRSIDWKGESIITGGEDSRVCVWKPSVLGAEGDSLNLAARPLEYKANGIKSARKVAKPY